MKILEKIKNYLFDSQIKTTDFFGVHLRETIRVLFKRKEIKK